MDKITGDATALLDPLWKLTTVYLKSWGKIAD